MRELDAVALEIANHRLAAIAEEMGVVLGRTALSPNVKERRDYSCAVFDALGALVAQAAHIPVHLGATTVTSGRCVPPANGSFTTATSSGPIATRSMAARTESGVAPRCTGMCAAWATSAPWASNTAHE